MRFAIISKFKDFLTSVEKEHDKLPSDVVSFKEVEKNLDNEKRKLERILSQLDSLTDGDQAKRAVQEVKTTANSIVMLANDANAVLKSYEISRSQLFHLASLGLMVEILAHELNRASTSTLATIVKIRSLGVDSDISRLFSTLESQMKALQKRIKILDPLSTSVRNKKETFDISEWVDEIFKFHSDQFLRHNIKYTIEITKGEGAPRITTYKGMLVQILENLISNSVYWLKMRQKTDEGFHPRISVRIDMREMALMYSDNGPGIPNNMQEAVFEPFVTTKPAGEGKGLGLYISRELAKYAGLDLRLDPKSSAQDASINTFILSLDGAPDRSNE